MNKTLKKNLILLTSTALLSACSIINGGGSSSTSSSSSSSDDSSTVTPTENHYLNYYTGGELYYTQKLYKNILLDFPESPTKSGYTFSGWYFDENVWSEKLTDDYFVGKEIEDNYSVYACFKENAAQTYYLNYYVDGELYVTSRLYRNILLTLPDDPVKENYTFKGWYFDENEWNVKLTDDYFVGAEIAQNYSVYAYFEKTIVERIGIAVWCGSYHFPINDNGEQAVKDLAAIGVDTIIGICPTFTGGDAAFEKLCDVCSENNINLIPNATPWDSVNSDWGTWDGSAPSWINNDAVIGVLAQDEPAYTEIDDLAAKKKVFDADPASEGKAFFVNLRNANFIYASDKVEYQDYIDEVFEKINPDIVGTDCYPLLASGRIYRQHYKTLEYVGKAAKKHGVPFYNTICSAEHSAGNDGMISAPTEENMNWQNALSLNYGADCIPQYVYASHTDGYTCMADTHGQKLDLYSTVEKVNADLRAYDELFAQYEWLGTNAYDDGDGNLMMEYLSDNIDVSKYGVVSSVSTSGGDILTSIYQNKKDSRLALRITNAGETSTSTSVNTAPFTMKSIGTVTVKFSGTSYKKANVITDKGVLTEQSISNQTLMLSLPAYGSVFIELLK